MARAENEFSYIVGQLGSANEELETFYASFRAFILNRGVESWKKQDTDIG